MKFGVRLPRTGPFASAASMIKVAQSTEELGFDSVTVNDHISWTRERRYHFAVGTVEAMDKVERGTNAYDALTTISFVAGITQKIRLIPAGLVLPWRGPVMLAKQYATLQELSNGRAILGICIGNIEEDFRNFGVTFKERGAITNEYLAAIKELFSDKPEITFKGKYAEFSGEFYPKATKLSIWIAGGFNLSGLKRAAQFADGWLPVGTPEQLRDGLNIIKDFQKEYGRTSIDLENGPETFACIAETSAKAWKIAEGTVRKFGGLSEIARVAEGPFTEMNLVGSIDDVSKRIEEYEKAGANYVELKFIANNLQEVLDQMSLFASQIAPSFAS